MGKKQAFRYSGEIDTMVNLVLFLFFLVIVVGLLLAICEIYSGG